MSTIVSDIRFAIRALRRSPGFTAIAILTLGLGIGANTAMFTVVNDVVLRPLPFADADRLVAVNETSPKRDINDYEVSYPNFAAWREQSSVFAGLAAYLPMSATLEAGTDPVRVAGQHATADLFSVLGASPALGRVLLPGDEVPGAPRVVVIGHGLWERQFGARENAIGSTLRLDGISHTVVGVMERGFPFQNEAVDYWVPLIPEPWTRNRAVHILVVVGRLRSTAPLADASSEMDVIAARLREQFPNADSDHGAHVEPLLARTVAGVRQTLFLLAAAVGVVLLMTCTNIAGLLLARAVPRRRELAIRAAIGATRARIVRQLLTEGIVLGALGGVAGLLLATWGVDFVAARLPGAFPRASAISVDPAALIFTSLVSLSAGALFGLAPVVALGPASLRAGIESRGGRGTTPAGRRLRDALIVAEVALSLVLLTGAGLLLESMRRVVTVDPGFRPERLLTLTVELPPEKYQDNERIAAFFRELPARLRQLPGIVDAGGVSTLPISGGDGNGDLSAEGMTIPPDQTPTASYRRVLPGYFGVMGIPLIRGRDFDERDGAGPPVVIINEGMASRLWPGQDPIGRRIKVGPSEREPWLTVVGVVGDVRNVALDRPARLATYEPHRQRPWTTMQMVVRAAGDPVASAPAVRAVLKTVDPAVRTFDVGTMDRRVSASLAPRRFMLSLIGAFASIAVLLAALGVYGVVAQSVTQRTREIGIRVALGATPRRVLTLAVSQGAGLVAAGLVAGLGLSLVASRSMSTSLYGVTPTEPVVYGVVTGVLTLVALVACWLPARSATRVDPLVALRHE